MTVKKEPTVPVGLHRKTNKPTLISELTPDEKGLRCECVCPNPDCGDRLIARFYKGKTVNHFAHYRKPATPKCSEYGLHLAGETILSYQNSITFPQTVIRPSERVIDDFGIAIEVPAVNEFKGNTLVPVEGLAREVTISDDESDTTIRGDVVGTAMYEGQHFKLNLEVKVTHEVDEEKLEKLKKLDITTIEIDISHLHGTPWTVENVSEAIRNPNNMTLLHIHSSMMTEFRATADNWKAQYVKENLDIHRSYYNILIERLTRKPLLLPPYYPKWTDDKAWVDYYAQNKAQIVEKLQKRHQFHVVAVQHIKHNHILLKLKPTRARNKEKPLELHAFIDLLERPVDATFDTYLLINEKVITEGVYNSRSIQWGKNKKMEDVQKGYEAIAQREWSAKQERIQAGRSRLKDSANSMQVPKGAAIAAATAAKELKDTGLFDSFYCDLNMRFQCEYRVFNVPNDIWQLICAHYVMKHGTMRYGKILNILREKGIYPSSHYKNMHESLELPEYYDVFSRFMRAVKYIARALYIDQNTFKQTQ